MVSAERRLAASSKDDDVRVELSKKTFTTVRPRRVGTFFTSRASTPSKPLRGVEDALDVLALEVGDVDQVALAHRRLSARGGHQHDLVDLVGLQQPHRHALRARGRQVLAHVVRADRQLAVAAVGQHGELHPRRAAVVEDRVDGRADGAAR